jgi:16S rRNA (guanine527-N7)-methyltransferase
VLAAWSKHVNLTAAKSAEARVRILIAPIIPFAPRLEPGLLLDVGSGNGSPGLVLALLRPDLPATLLEPRAKRWAFLREAARAGGRPDVSVLRARHDSYQGPPASSVTLRALALPLRELGPLVAPGGRLLCFGGSPRAEAPFALEAERGGVRAFRRA